MSRKERSILIRVTDKEREIIKRKAAKLGMTVSEYVRTALIHTDNLNITMIDVRPIEKIATELHKQGVNLNQLMKFLNTYGVDVYNADETFRVLTREGDMFLKVSDVLGQLCEEAARHKTESGKRYIYMTDEVMTAFEHVMASRPKAKPLSVDGRTGFIFLNRDGLPRVGGDYDRVFRGLRRKYAKGGGVPLPEDMTPHTLRHTFCTEMAKAGMNPKALQYIMGHKDIKMTLGYYAHMDGCTAAEEMRRVAA